MLEFSWLSFGFAVVNFLILVALLWKFLHKPLLGALEKRRKGIEDAAQQARDETDKARRIREEYEGKLAAAARERDTLLAEARQSAEENRRKLLDQAGADSEREVANLKRAYKREQGEALNAIQESVADAAVDVAGTILARIADTDLEARLGQQLIDKLDELDASDAQNLHAVGDNSLPVLVMSAKPLGDGRREEILVRIKKVAGEEAEVTFDTDNSLVAGVRVDFSAMTVDASLSDILCGVRERVVLPPGSGPAEEAQS